MESICQTLAPVIISANMNTLLPWPYIKVVLIEAIDLPIVVFPQNCYIKQLYKAKNVKFLPIAKKVAFK